MGLPSSFLQLSHGDPTLLAQQEGSRWEWPGCLTWAHPYILTTNKSDHETSAGLGWAGLGEGEESLKQRCWGQLWVQILDLPLIGRVAV